MHYFPNFVWCTQNVRISLQPSFTFAIVLSDCMFASEHLCVCFHVPCERAWSRCYHGTVERWVRKSFPKEACLVLSAANFRLYYFAALLKSDQQTMKLLERNARTYLASNLQKTVFAEHAIDEDDGKKGKKKASRCRCYHSLTIWPYSIIAHEDRQAGKQRGFIVFTPQLFASFSFISWHGRHGSHFSKIIRCLIYFHIICFMISLHL